ncbi:MAG TPA: endonuclease/exonuclease/phosphatase family protein [Anaerolineae bacterium]|nr:endonuclease/exonuclease/phosphatase family protein [Anaerolineae bacterium]
MMLHIARATKPALSFEVLIVRGTTLRILIPLSLLVAFGLQLFRLWTAGLLYFLYETAGAAPRDMLTVAIIVFGAAFLAGVVRKGLGARAVWIVGSGVAVSRAIEQISLSPALDMILTSIGTICFLWFIVISFDTLLAAKLDRHFPTALLLGISIDTALKGAAGTIDLSWLPGLLPIMIIVALAAVALWSLRGLPQPDRLEAQPASWSLIGFGPFLFLQAQMLQNIGFHSAVTDWPLPLSFELIILANAVGLVMASIVYDRMPSRAWTWTVVIGLILIVVSLPLEGDPLAALELFAGQMIASIGLAIIAQARGRARSSIVFGITFVLMMALLIGYYLGHIVLLPIPYWAFVALAALILAITMILTVRRFPEPHPTDRVDWTAGFIGLGLMILPVIALLTWHDPIATAEQFPVRVMSYNLHSGFDVQGRMDLEAIAQTIESEQADVVALQEVSRGWVIDTSADMVTWLSQRLNMPYVWGPTADALWGNAILSRYPIEQVQLHMMPNNDLIRPARGFIDAMLNVGGRPLHVIATHLHHVDADGTLRVPQVQAILDTWAQQPRTIVLGDLNALPDSREMRLLREAGLSDAFTSSGATGEGFTFRSDDLNRRIDYIYHSLDLIARDFHVNPSRASDHAAIAVTLSVN